VQEVNICDVVIMGALGNMGSTLASLAEASPDHRLAAVLARPERVAELSKYDCVRGSDLSEILPRFPGAVVIDFTAPAYSVNVAAIAAECGNPVVIGATGLSDEQAASLFDFAKKSRIFWAPNMSVGLNTLLQILPLLVEKLGLAYNLEIVETHHNKKVDSPSGTAIRLGQCLAEARNQEFDKVRKYCRDGVIGPRTVEEIGVQTLRGGDVVGDHTVYFFGPGERIEVTHRAHSRKTLGRGALRAASWISAQAPGRLYSMPDMLG
jgi:4-hydroxy-tetrahydrodipicolinate reductase